MVELVAQSSQAAMIKHTNLAIVTLCAKTVYGKFRCLVAIFINEMLCVGNTGNSEGRPAYKDILD